MLATAPISSPPAEPPRADNRSVDVYPASHRWRAQVTKSVNVLRLCSSFPSSYQCRPHSPPPRTCAIGEHEAAVEQRQAQHREPRVGTDLVRPVAVEEAWRGPVAGDAVAAHERDGDPRAVVRGGPLSRRVVVGRVVAAEHRLLLAQDERARRELVVVHGGWGDERFVAQPVHVGRVLGVLAWFH